MRRQARWAQAGRLVQDPQICNWRVMCNVVYAMHNECAIWSSYEWMKSLTCKVAATCVYALPHSHSTKSLASTFAFFSVHRCLCYMQLLFLPPLHPHWLQLPDGGCEWGLQLCLHADKWFSCTCTMGLFLTTTTTLILSEWHTLTVSGIGGWVWNWCSSAWTFPGCQVTAVLPELCWNALLSCNYAVVLAESHSNLWWVGTCVHILQLSLKPCQSLRNRIHTNWIA